MSATLDADIRVEDIEYRPGLLARLYRPAGPGPFPAIVDVHGGAWVNSDRFNNAPVHQDLARNGIVTLALDFRMPPDAAYPGSLQDINYGVRWFKSRASEFGTSADRIGLFGTSSGGHQVLLAAMRPFDPRYAAHPLPEAPDVDASVAFVISAWGVLCPLVRYGIAREAGNTSILDSHHRFWGTEAAMSEGSPPLILERGEPVKTPPAWVFQGDADEWVPNEVAERLATAWRRAGGALELTLFPGEKHTFMRNHPDTPNSQRALAMLKAFIKQHG
jgi:acetyl esterase/lipase